MNNLLGFKSSLKTSALLEVIKQVNVKEIFRDRIIHREEIKKSVKSSIASGMEESALYEMFVKEQHDQHLRVID